MKHETVAPAKKEHSWLVNPETARTSDLATQIMNIMEQGIIVWSAEGYCELHNTRIYEVLELDHEALTIGTKRSEFLKGAALRAEFSEEIRVRIEGLFRAGQPFSIDRQMPSGRIVATNARPARGGSYVVTYTDVTEARQAAQDLAAAKRAAEQAQEKVTSVLEHERARQREASKLSELDEWLQSCKSLDELFEIVTTFMMRLLPNWRGQLFIYSNSRDVLDGACQWNTTITQSYITPDSCWALRRGRSYAFEPDALCFSCDHVRETHDENPANDYLCVPIVAHGDTVGLLHLEEMETAQNDFIVDPKTFALRCGEHVSMAIANVKLRDELQDQSTRDPLTGLYNRRYFMDALRREVAQSVTRKTSLALLAFDADRFKNFNDDHGHDAGDVVLRAISEVLTEFLPKGGTACRYGGEEFAVLLPAISSDDAVAVAQTLCERIALTEVRYGTTTLPKVTISTGVALMPDHATQPQTLLKMADEALYAAKDAGRNCVVLAKGADTSGVAQTR